jgi:hypothetical protein
MSKRFSSLILALLLVQIAYPRDTLTSDDLVLYENQALNSLNGVYSAKMQNDGNFVVSNGVIPLWTSNTGSVGPYELRMQREGNLVVYDGNFVALWASCSTPETCPGVAPFRLVMQDEGNLDL